MGEASRIEDQLKRAYEGEAWHGPSVLELMRDVAADKAAAKPIADAHSIWEIALHIAAWEKIALRRLEGEIVEPSAEEDWPPVEEKSESKWRETLLLLEKSNRELRSAVSQLDDNRLRDTAPGCNYSIYFLLHGVIQHDLYHAGQIALLKKMKI